MALACAPGGSPTRARCSRGADPGLRPPRRAPAAPAGRSVRASTGLGLVRAARSRRPSAAAGTCSASGCCACRAGPTSRRPHGSCRRCSSRARASSGRSPRRASTTSRRRSRPERRERAPRCCCSPMAARCGTARSAGRASPCSVEAASDSARACARSGAARLAPVTCRSCRPRTSTRAERATAGGIRGSPARRHDRGVRPRDRTAPLASAASRRAGPCLGSAPALAGGADRRSPSTSARAQRSSATGKHASPKARRSTVPRRAS